MNTSATYPSGPRKAIVGTTVFSLFAAERPYIDLEHRIDEVRGRLREMSADARLRHGRGLDIAVFPENVLNSRSGETLAERSVVLDEAVMSALGGMAREERAWLAICSNVRETKETDVVYNACLLFDRDGHLVGTYRKVYCLPDENGMSVERGKRPGTEFPVFDTDFGRVALLICFDMGFEEVMQAYAANRAELLLWPSMSPQTFLPRMYARQYGFHIVSATPRASACVVDPMGEIVAKISCEGVLTTEIDLDFRIVHWQAELRQGQALTERFGDRVGFRYLDDEDYGIFWSNDPTLPIAQMLEEAGILTDESLRSLARTARQRVLGGVA